MTATFVFGGRARSLRRQFFFGHIYPVIVHDIDTAIMPKGKKSASGPTKTQLMSELATTTGLTKKQVESVFEALEAAIHRELRKPEGQIVALPGLLAIKKVNKAARPARMGRNPATGEQMMFKAKPASKAVKVSPRKGLKEMV